MKYNSLESDYGFCKISKEKAIEYVKTLKNKWIYIELNHYLKKMENLSDCTSNRNKLKCSDIRIFNGSLEIMGQEDNDRLYVRLEKLIQSEISETNETIKLIISYETHRSVIYLKEFIPNKERLINTIPNINENLIITEGKSDWKHLKSAFSELKKENLYRDLDFKFFEYENSLSEFNNSIINQNLQGSSTLLTICEYNALFKNEKIRIFVFDADEQNTIKKIKNYPLNDGYYNFGNNVYAIILPVPELRKEYPEISIEHYYTDEEIKTTDQNGRRLYLSEEFNFENPNITIFSMKADKQNPKLIIDNNSGTKKYQGVYQGNNLKIKNHVDLKKAIDTGKLTKIEALTKNDFAENILNDIFPFSNFSKENFKLFFDIVEKLFINNIDNIKISNEKKLGFITEKIIRKGVYLKYYMPPDAGGFPLKNLYKELHLKIELSDDEIEKIRKPRKLELNIIEDEIILLIHNIKVIKLGNKNNEELENFIMDKAESDRNKVYLDIYNNQKYISSFELFNGDKGKIYFFNFYSRLNLQIDDK